MNKSILEVVHESVEELQQHGLVDDISMREFDALCLPPVKNLTAIQIKTIRKKIRQARQFLPHI